MTTLSKIALGVALSLPAASFAQGFSGGSVELGYTDYGKPADFSSTAFAVRLEYAITRSFSIQGNYASTSIDAGSINNSTSAIDLHGIYHANDATSVGIFYGVDFDEDDPADTGADYYGLEAGYEQNQFEIEGYISRVDFDSAPEADMIGIMAAYEITPTISANINYDRLDAGTADFNKLGLGVDYAVAGNVVLGGEIGQVDDSTTDNSTYFGLGVTVNFGAERGATFERRDPGSIYAGY